MYCIVQYLAFLYWVFTFISKLAGGAWWEQMPLYSLANDTQNNSSRKTSRALYLVVRVDEWLSKNDILSSGSRKDNNLGNVIRRKRIAAADEHVRIHISKVKKERWWDSLTHKWHRPWTCRRRSEQRRTPSDIWWANCTWKIHAKMKNPVPFQPGQGQPQWPWCEWQWAPFASFQWSFGQRPWWRSRLSLRDTVPDL